MIDRVCEVEDTINYKGEYDTCILEDDYTISFERDTPSRGGGAFLTKNHYKHLGYTYGEAVVNYLQSIQKTNKPFWKKIMAMIEPYNKGYMPLYFNAIAKPKLEIKFPNKILKKNLEKSQKKVSFAIQVIERLRYEVHDLTWKKHIDEALKELKNDR